MIVNVLADRYASEEIKNIWSNKGKILLERDLWIAVMKAQKELGIDIPQEAIDAYEKVKDNVDLASIKERERINRHDVKARIEEFCDLAGHQHIHKGMTSRDLTENAEQLQIFKSLLIIKKKAAASLLAFQKAAEKYRDQVFTARTHNVAAQPTSLGKRFAMFGQELLEAYNHLDYLINNFSARGLKGAVGTGLDQITLFGGDANKASLLEEKLVKHLGIPFTLNAVGQVYPRSLDFKIVSIFYELSSGISSFAKTLRIMAGNETASEGFAKGQVGSSAMPHKMNSRSCERINGFHVILNGYMNMLAGLSGDQWNEGDVSCSVVRRLALPNSVFAIDGVFETFLTVMQQFEVYEPVIAKENAYYMPFLCTTTIMMEAVKNGAGREDVHEAIKEHAVAALLDLRSGQIVENDLATRLAEDSRIGLEKAQLEQIIEQGYKLIGLAAEQVDNFSRSVNEIIKNFSEAENYKPGNIL